jgi:hypothetical protein
MMSFWTWRSVLLSRFPEDKTLPADAAAVSK